ncbi:MAG: RHS repeat-associated core domain-containing protein [Gemmataceae bacterium]
MTVLDASWNALAASAFAWVYLHQGGRFDATSGLYHFRHRDYSPSLGRWTSLDPLGYAAGDANLYRTVFNAPTIYTDPSGQILPLLVIGGVLLAGAGIGGLHYAASRYDYAREHYLSRPIQQRTPEVQAEYREYVRTTDWIAAGSEVTAVTGISMVATPYLGYGSGYLWTAGGTGGRILVGTAGVGGLGYAGYDGYTIVRDWDTMEGPERLRRVGDLAGPTLVAVGTGPRFFRLRPVHGHVRVAPTGIVAQNGTRITGFTRHGINRAIGDGAGRAGTTPAAILDALKNPKSITSGVDQLGRPFQIFTGQNARVVVNPQTGQIVSVNPLSGAGAH